MARPATGKRFRKGISLVAIMSMFPEDDAAKAWLVANHWSDGVYCPHCGSLKVQTGAAHLTMPYRCRARKCRKRFSTNSGTAMRASKLNCRVWAITLYRSLTPLKSVSSMKLHWDMEITQNPAWFLAHRIRESFAIRNAPLAGPVEADETWVGGKKLKDGGIPVGETAVAGIWDRGTNEIRVKVVKKTDAEMLKEFIGKHNFRDSDMIDQKAVIMARMGAGG